MFPTYSEPIRTYIRTYPDRSIKQFRRELSRSTLFCPAGQEQLADGLLAMDAADGIRQQPRHVHDLDLGTLLEAVERYGIADDDLVDG